MLRGERIGRLVLKVRKHSTRKEEFLVISTLNWKLVFGKALISTLDWEL